jgi:hypothetical protein
MPAGVDAVPGLTPPGVLSVVRGVVFGVGWAVGLDAKLEAAL